MSIITLILTMILELMLCFKWVQTKGQNITRTRQIEQCASCICHPWMSLLTLHRVTGQVKVPATVLPWLSVFDLEIFFLLCKHTCLVSLLCICRSLHEDDPISPKGEYRLSSQCTEEGGKGQIIPERLLLSSLKIFLRWNKINTPKEPVKTF